MTKHVFTNATVSINKPRPGYHGSTRQRLNAAARLCATVGLGILLGVPAVSKVDAAVMGVIVVCASFLVERLTRRRR